MRLRLRRGAFVGLLLLFAVFLFLFLFSRLDANQLQQAAAFQVAQITGLTMHSGKPSLSLLHGVSLKLPQLRIGEDGDAWHLAANVVHIDISLWSLLTGKLHFSAIDVVHPSLYLSSVISPQELFAMDLPDQIGKLHIRNGQFFVDGKVLAEDVIVVVRRIAREKQTSWEVQSRFAGGDISGQGYVRFGKASQREAFGRLSADQLFIKQLPTLPFPTSHYDIFDASLTFSMNAHQQWQWSGNFHSHDSHKKIPDLSLRGKILGRNWHDFQLQDVQASFGKQTRIQMAGGCLAGQACVLEMNTYDADMQHLLDAFDVKNSLSAALDGSIKLQEKKKGWKITGDFALRHVRWADTDLPDVRIKLPKASFISMHDFRLPEVSIKPVEGKGEILISAKRRGEKNGFVNVSMINLDTAWVPLGNIALQASGWEWHLAGKGSLSGTLESAFEPGKLQFGFQLDATDGKMTLGGFSKPAGMRAKLIGKYFPDDKGGSFQLSEMQLGDSYIKKAGWHMSGGRKLAFAGNSRIDLLALRAAGLQFPEKFAAWHGRIKGDLDGFSIDRDEAVLHRFVASNGSLYLNAFGSGEDEWGGKITFGKGEIRAPSLHWQDGDKFADIATRLDLRTMRGKMDIRGSKIEWSPEDGLPAWLGDMHLQGEFADVDLAWDDNLWKNMHGSYVLSGGKLELKKARGKFAGGRVQSRRMRLQMRDGGADFDGRLRMSAVYLEKMNGLAHAVGANMHGYIFFNGLIGGHLPLGSGPAWYGNGDIEIHNGRWNEAKAAHLVLWRNNEAGSGKPVVGGGFSRLAARYRFTRSGLELSHLEFNKNGMQMRGKANITSQGDIHGYLKARAGKQKSVTDISGRWPSIIPFFAGGNATSDGFVR